MRQILRTHAVKIAAALLRPHGETGVCVIMGTESVKPDTLKTLKMTAKMDGLSRASDFVKETLLAAGCSEKMCKQMDIVVEEIFINIASYAYPQEAIERPVVIECGRKADCVYLTFRDRGVQYNPLEKEDPAIGIVEEMTIGGYGIFMVKNIVDEIEYQYAYEEEENVLRMRKRIGL